MMIEHKIDNSDSIVEQNIDNIIAQPNPLTTEMKIEEIDKEYEYNSDDSDDDED